GYMQGHSVKQILANGKEPSNWERSTNNGYWMHMVHNFGTPGHFGIRTRQYKLIFFYGRDWIDTEDEYKNIFPKSKRDKNFEIQTPAAWEFHDLKNDPEEMNNLYGDPAYKDII